MSVDAFHDRTARCTGDHLVCAAIQDSHVAADHSCCTPTECPPLATQIAQGQARRDTADLTPTNLLSRLGQRYYFDVEFHAQVCQAVILIAAAWSQDHDGQVMPPDLLRAARTGAGTALLLAESAT